ncbi:PREDICTED: uncharacterized protein LOC106331050 [Brassica oleracea var. oleracea]|uniref:uncharacterized protein LOC106331050 n=1 Tax=Brassica oleracea var. oleracea TaxID=109376 RepID=UPI0006A6CFE0|nr:PREDICTED: uncharacterized protein LOC106331050 [Brassica oleracea var. oleracea]
MEHVILRQKEVAEERSKEAEVKLAVREGKKEVAEAYGKILVCVKEKFARKKDEVDALVYAQELQANADLLKDMLNNKIQSVEEEYNQLVALLPEATTAYEKAQVSDFSVSKLPLPQISESSAPVEAASGAASCLDFIDKWLRGLDGAPGALVAMSILGFSIPSTGIIRFTRGSDVEANAASASAEEFSPRGILVSSNLSNCFVRFRTTSRYAPILSSLVSYSP